MTPEREAQMREVFEAWAEPRGYSLTRTTDSYLSKGTRSAWRGFLACARALEPEIRDAARYRLLRAGDNDKEFLQFSEHARDGTDDVWLLREEKLDEAIDSALSAALEEGNATE